jgi:hypothetical protein
MTDIIVATVTKNSREEIRIALGEFNGRQIINLRVWFRTDEEEWRPGKGLACHIDLLPQLVEGLAKAERHARAEGLIP